MASKNKNSLWGSRFSAGPSPEMANLSKSTHFDWRLAKYDLLGSKAHAEALAAKGYLNEGELKELIKLLISSNLGLRRVRLNPNQQTRMFTQPWKGV
jgi:argininosuccinate lyase